MLYRTIYIGNPAYLRLKDKQLKVIRPRDDLAIGSVPIEDLGMLILDHPQITMTHQLIQALVSSNAVIVSCDPKHLPQGLMLPLYGHTEFTEHARIQLEADLPLKKRLWKQVVQAKIANQRALLKERGLPTDPMDDYIRGVRSGDSTNMEGIAAQYYWRTLFSSDFLRGQYDDLANSLLNYGYAILRSIVARALTASGLLLMTGLFHRNKYNPLCLADDIMEPFRPFIDRMALCWLDNHPDNEETLTQEAKTYLIECATQDTYINGRTHPLLVSVRNSCTSLYKCFDGSRKQLVFPPSPPDTLMSLLYD